MPSLARWIALQRPQYRSGAAFSPLDVSGLQLWLDPDSGLTDPTWTARSGPNATLVSSPTINATDANFNGKKTITLNGTDEYITVDAIGAVLEGSDTPFAVVCAFRHTTFAGAAHISFCAAKSDSTQYHFLATNQTTGVDRIDRDDTGSSATSVLGDPAASVDTTYIYVHRFNGTTVDLWRNGTKVIDGAALDKLSIAMDWYTIGAFRRNATITNHFVGQVGEHLIYTPVPTLAQLNQIQNYVAQKYNVTVATLA